MKLLFKLTVIALPIFLVSCASSKSVYKDFYSSQKRKIVATSSDGTVLQDAKGNLNAFLANDSKKLVSQIQQLSLKALSSKGYLPSSEYVSTGLSVPISAAAYITNDIKAKDGPRLTGAHYLRKRNSTSSKTQAYALERIYDRIFSMNVLSKQAKQTHFPELQDIGLSSKGYICLVSGFTRNVNTGKQIGQAVLTSALSLGMVTMYEPDFSTIRVVLLDPRTQRIVWANQSSAATSKSGSIYKKISSAFEKLPMQNSQIAP